MLQDLMKLMIKEYGVHAVASTFSGLTLAKVDLGVTRSSVDCYALRMYGKLSKVTRIKACGKLTNIGLKEAKQWVETQYPELGW